MIDDHMLQESVMAELEWEPSVDAAHIGVAVTNGVVTLTGFVPSYAAKIAAERAAGRVLGVKAIAEELEIRLPSERRHADSEIAERALRILAWDAQVPDDQLKVKVEHGFVTLSGEVSFRFERNAAEAAVQRLGGVRGVVNAIRVTAQLRPGPDAELVHERIESALRRNAELEAAGIRVSLVGGHATLQGSVRSWAERRAAEDAIWASPGVDDVTNHLVVQA